MKKFKLAKCQVAWTPEYRTSKPHTVGKIVVGSPYADPHHEYAMWQYAGRNCSVGAKPTETEALALLFILFHTLVVRDKMDPQVVHTAFLQIEEYCTALAPDTEGATSRGFM